MINETEEEQICYYCQETDVFMKKDEKGKNICMICRIDKE